MTTPTFSDSNKILIVDDVPSARKVVERLLKSFQITSSEHAPNGRIALEKLAAGNIGLVISDWDMPELNGLELLEKARHDPKFKNIPFIIVTSSSDRDTVIQAAKLGASDFIVKPFSGDTLWMKIEQLVKQAGS